MRIVIVTCPPGAGEALVRTLLAERLVACGNIVPGVRSLYRWKGETCDEPEEVLFMETAADRLDAMMRRLAELHPYEVPKILAIDPREAWPAYARWVAEETAVG